MPGYGFGLGNGMAAEGWTDEEIVFRQRQIGGKEE